MISKHFSNFCCYALISKSKNLQKVYKHLFSKLYMKKRAIAFILISVLVISILLSMSFVSANWFTDLFKPKEDVRLSGSDQLSDRVEIIVTAPGAPSSARAIIEIRDKLDNSVLLTNTYATLGQQYPFSGTNILDKVIYIYVKGVNNYNEWNGITCSFIIRSSGGIVTKTITLEAGQGYSSCTGGSGTPTVNQITTCTTISQPGTYTLANNIAATGTETCITINSDNVILDGAGFTITGNVNSNTGDISGLHAYGKKNLQIKNLKITRFAHGIYLRGDTQHPTENALVQNNEVYSNTVDGIIVIGHRNTLSGNKISLSQRYGLQTGGNENIFNNNEVCNNGLKDVVCYAGLTLPVGQGNTGTGNKFTNVEGCIQGWPILNTHYVQCGSSTGGCTPTWTCTQWSTCSNGLQTRTCTDLNNCGVITNKPSGTQSCISDPLPVGFIPVTGYWHRNPAIANSLGIIGLWNARGELYYSGDGINFKKWTDAEKTNAGLPLNYKPILAYYEGFPGKEDIVLVDANKVIYIWNYATGKYVLKSSWFNGVDNNLVPTTDGTAYWQDTGKNGGTVSLISPTAWYVARSDGVFSKLTSSVPGLPFDPAQGRFTPKVAYYMNYTSGDFGTFDLNNPSSTTRDVREVYAWIFNSTSRHAELYKYPHPGYAISDTFGLVLNSKETSNGYTFNLTYLDKSSNPIKATIKVTAPNGDMEVKTFSLLNPTPLLELLTFTTLGLNVRVWMVGSTNQGVLLTYYKGSVINKFYRITPSGVPIDKVPDVGYYDRIRKKTVLWYGADTYESGNGYQFTKVRGETSVTAPTCIDTDGGKTYYTQGSTGSSILGNPNVDSCDSTDASGKKLIEYYCENNVIKNTAYTCSNRCSNGKCIFVEANQNTCNKNACGDVDSSGTLTNVDKEIIDGILQSPEWWTNDPFRYNRCYDLNNDGRISVLDSSIAERALAGNNVCSSGGVSEGICREFCSGSGGAECPNAGQVKCPSPGGVEVCRDRADCNVIIGLPNNFAPVTGYWHKNPAATNLGVVALLDVNGNVYYTADGINFVRWTDAEKTNAGLPLNYKPVLAYYQGFPGKQNIVLVNSTRGIYVWNYTSQKYMLTSSGFGNDANIPAGGLPYGFSPTAGYWHNMGGNEGKASLFNGTRWYVGDSGGSFTQINPVNYNLPNSDPEFGYYYEFANGQKGVQLWYNINGQGKMYKFNPSTNKYELASLSNMPSTAPTAGYFDKISNRIIIWYGADAYKLVDGVNFIQIHGDSGGGGTPACNVEICGDVNNDGEANGVDLQLVSLGIPGNQYNECYDLNNDNSVDDTDWYLVQKASLEFNICNIEGVNLETGICAASCAGQTTICNSDADCRAGAYSCDISRRVCVAVEGVGAECQDTDDCDRGTFCSEAGNCEEGECGVDRDCVGNKVCLDNFCEPPGQVRQRCRLASNDVELPVRTRIRDSGVVKYCDNDLAFKLAEAADATCNNDYECISNACIEGKCVAIATEIREQGVLLRRIWCWIIHPIDVSARGQCIAP